MFNKITFVALRQHSPVHTVNVRRSDVECCCGGRRHKEIRRQDWQTLLGRLRARLLQANSHVQYVCYISLCSLSCDMLNVSTSLAAGFIEYGLFIQTKCVFTSLSVFLM